MILVVKYILKYNRLTFILSLKKLIISIKFENFEKTGFINLGKIDFKIFFSPPQKNLIFP